MVGFRQKAGRTVRILHRQLQQTAATGTAVRADSLYQNLNYLKTSHEPYVVIASGDGIYKMDYNKVLEYHIENESGYYDGCQENDRPFGD